MEKPSTSTNATLTSSQTMAKKSGAALLFTVTSALLLSLLAPATAANLDDGYPQNTAAPGRTCPMADEGFKTVSDYSGKTLVCTMINGTKRWWIQGDPLPEAPSAGNTPAPGNTSDIRSDNQLLDTADTSRRDIAAFPIQQR